MYTFVNNEQSMKYWKKIIKPPVFHALFGMKFCYFDNLFLSIPREQAIGMFTICFGSDCHDCNQVLDNLFVPVDVRGVVSCYGCQ